ncbi:Chaperone SurA [bioreactor metagenome]|uniref:Chaperone SurA n=1 Tax=bioreactor metagenome TaxID=1076179 RepID=A0A644ZIB2_9ZZZZ
MSHEHHACTCGSGGAGCGSMSDAAPAAQARINGIALHSALESLDAQTLRQRACTELLRQQAQQLGLLDASDLPDVHGAISEAAEQAIEQLLARELVLPDPSEEACQRYYAAHPLFRDEQVRLRHVLFAVTPGVDVRALRQRAEAALLELRTQDANESMRFADVARELSNCPSGAQGGELGWLSRADCAPEFAAEVFSSNEVGVLARLVHSRFGLHVVEVRERSTGEPIGYDDARTSVMRTLEQQTWTNAVRQYLQVLAGAAHIEGVDIDAAASPLVQ